VTVGAGHTVTVDTNAVANTLTIATSGTLQFATNVTPYTLNVGAGGIQNSGRFDATNAGAIVSVATNALTHGIYNAPTGVFTAGAGAIAATATQGIGLENDGTFTSGAGLISIGILRNGVSNSAASFTVGAGGVTITETVNPNGLAPTNGTFTLNGNLTNRYNIDAGVATFSGTGKIILTDANHTIIGPVNLYNLEIAPLTAARTITINTGAITATGTTQLNGVLGNLISFTGTGNITAFTSYSCFSNGGIITNITCNPKANQTITFGALSNKTYGDAPFLVSATASSSLAVSFAATGNCTMLGSTVTLTGAGSCTVTASQGGDANYVAAVDVLQTFSIGNASQTIPISPTPSPLPASLPAPPPLPDYLGLFLQLDGTGTGKVTNETGLSCQSSDCQRALDGTLTCNPQTCKQVVKSYSTVTLTPQADVGSVFSSWGGHPDCVTGQFMMDSGKLCIAFFHLLDEPLTVTVQGQGHITDTNLHCSDNCVVNYLYGTAVTLLASPANDWLFQAWSGDCNSTGQVLMTGPKTCGATFIPDPVTLDNDLDHTTSVVEDAAPNHGDGNGDGILDSLQNHVSSFVDLVSEKYLTLQVAKTCPITNVYSDFPEHYAGVNSNHKFLQGVTYFELSCAKTQVTIYYHRVSRLYSNLRFYKFGPTVPGDMKTVGWYKYPATFAVVKIGGLPVLTATYTLTDGQLGDNTGVDGKIVDPAGIELE
jgi:hypothetical protein